jgi:PAS domain S-box-containing protein
VSDLFPLLLLTLAGGGFLIGGLVLRTESGGRWAASWALLALAGLCVALSERVPAARFLSYVFGSCFPFAVLAGALRYAGRREPAWLIAAALGVAAARVALAAAGHPDATAALALMVDPSAIMGAAWLVARASHGRNAWHQVLAPGFVLLAAVEAYDGFLQIRAGDVATAPWMFWILAAVPLAAAQIVAALRSIQISRAQTEAALRESVAHLRDAERVARIGSFEWREGAKATFCSEETLRILGIEGGPEVSNERLLALLRPEQRAWAVRFASTALDAREPIEIELTLASSGGVERLAQVRLEPTRGADGELLRVGGSVRDVTEARQSGEALRKSEERLRAILSSLGNTRVAVLGRGGELLEVYGDGPAARRYGLSWSQAVGRRPRDFVDAEQSEQTWSVIEQVFTTGKSRELVQRADLPGGRFWFDASISPLCDPSGEVREVLVVARDITDQRKADEDRRAVEARLVQSQRLESLGVLAGGIAHDFNNLLVGILGNAELAQREVEPGSKAHDLVRDIQSASQRAAALTRQLLAYAGQTIVSPHTFDLAKLVAETLPLLHTSLPAASELRLEASGKGPWVYADEAQISQVVLNLVSNAAEALGEKGGAIRVRTSLVYADERLLGACLLSDGPAPGEFACLEVSDTGSGIAPEDLPRIFDPFFTTKFSGHGLGLAAVLGIVRGHGGTIRVESEPGRGSLFQVLLPAAPESSAVAGEFEASAQPPPRAARVLVVDDESMVRNTAARMLRSEGFEVVGAAGAREALERFAAERDEIDGALLDLTMPDMDGIELLDALRRLRPELPVVLMSGHSAEDALERVAGRSRAACVSKPFGLAALVAALASVLDPPREPGESGS